MTNFTDTQTQSILYTMTDSPIGRLLLTGTGSSLSQLQIEPLNGSFELDPSWTRDDTAFSTACRQLDAYFRGDLCGFDLDLRPRGTVFQKRVWTALQQIPYGTTLSYGDVAGRIGAPESARAVGAATGQNPVGIIIPCHRVTRAKGAIGGYAGGVDRKRALLRLESNHSP